LPVAGVPRFVRGVAVAAECVFDLLPVERHAACSHMTQEGV
jgi:hypothetical protein